MSKSGLFLALRTGGGARREAGEEADHGKDGAPAVEDARWEAESHLLAGLVTSKVMSQVLRGAGEAEGRLRELWLGNLHKHGGLILEEQPPPLPEQDHEADEIRQRSKYFKNVPRLKGRGRGESTFGKPPAFLARPALIKVADDQTGAVRESFALRCIVDLTAEQKENDVASAVAGIKRRLLSSTSSSSSSSSSTAQEEVVVQKGDPVQDAQWADNLGYPFHGLLVQHCDSGQQGRVSQIHFHSESGNLQSVVIRLSSGEEKTVLWPSRDVKCIIASSTSSSAAAAAAAAASVMVDDVDDEDDEDDEGGEEEEDVVDEDEDDNNDVMVDKLGLSDLGMDLRAAVASSEGVSGKKRRRKLRGSLPPLTDALLAMPLTHLPLPVEGQREALEARLAEAEAHFDSFSSLKPKFQPVNDRDGSLIAADAGIVDFGGKFKGSKSMDGVVLDALEDPSVDLDDPKCFIYGNARGALQRGKRSWTAVLRNVYVVTEGVSSILPECHLSLDPTQVIDPTQASAARTPATTL